MTKITKGMVNKVVDTFQFETHRVPGTNLTACWVFAPIGIDPKVYVGYGESICALDSEFNADDGIKYAKEAAIRNATTKVWEILGVHFRTTGGFLIEEDDLCGND